MSRDDGVCEHRASGLVRRDECDLCRVEDHSYRVLARRVVDLEPGQRVRVVRKVTVLPEPESEPLDLDHLHDLLHAWVHAQDRLYDAEGRRRGPGSGGESWRETEALGDVEDTIRGYLRGCEL